MQDNGDGEVMLRRVVVSIALTAGLACVLACGDDPGGEPGLPTYTGPATTTTTTSQPMTGGFSVEEQAVIEVGTRLIEVRNDMNRGAPLDESRLRAVAVDPELSNAIKNVRFGKDKKATSVGSYRLEPISVEITGDTATYVLCSDFSQVYVRINGKPQGKETPRPSAIHKVRMRLESAGGSWRVSKQETLSAGMCSVK